ncbi:RibT protein [Fructilactobacillus florum 8D]|uniref:RibT protein n=2 Tax=Fructilactobacillus florum TaxID=640331 RepID=W9EFE8_9LACO|nr:hypothetical protein [Fructilactobacillus florum]EKK20178.1 RibT protein [Fructilactobacillus florum 2F]ETO40863.1 RibT protein [Fructilactobacillus florum 8D]KRM91438.1 hypothetical protein FC87_GL000949 [Fructilactobacillus florum DSM 22689 = JCM 16035]
MLYKYQDDNKRIAMGILSLAKVRDRADYLEQELHWYNDSKQRNLYLWRDQFNNWAGVIGTESFSSCLVVRRITLTPDVNTVFNIFNVLDDLKQLYPDIPLQGTLATQNYLNTWEQNNERKNA